VDIALYDPRAAGALRGSCLGTAHRHWVLLERTETPLCFLEACLINEERYLKFNTAAAQPVWLFQK